MPYSGDAIGIQNDVRNCVKYYHYILGNPKNHSQISVTLNRFSDDIETH